MGGAGTKAIQLGASPRLEVFRLDDTWPAAFGPAGNALLPISIRYPANPFLDRSPTP